MLVLDKLLITHSVWSSGSFCEQIVTCINLIINESLYFLINFLYKKKGKQQLFHVQIIDVSISFLSQIKFCSMRQRHILDSRLSKPNQGGGNPSSPEISFLMNKSDSRSNFKSQRLLLDVQAKYHIFLKNQIFNTYSRIRIQRRKYKMQENTGTHFNLPFRKRTEK